MYQFLYKLVTYSKKPLYQLTPFYSKKKQNALNIKFKEDIMQPFKLPERNIFFDKPIVASLRQAQTLIKYINRKFF